MKPRVDISVLVTGANGGLGFETCKHLIKDGAKRIILACRTLEKAEAARSELERNAGSKLETALDIAGGFDMNSPASIEEAVAKLPPDTSLDTLFLQAGGVTYGTAWKTVSHNGHQVERTIFQNVLGGHITLAALLERGFLARGARIVAAGGEGARGIPKLIARPNFQSADALRDYVNVANREAPYSEMDAMGVSKFASALWVRHANRSHGEALEFVWFTPGLTAGTNGLAGVGATKQWLFENIGFPLMVLFRQAQTAEQGGRKFADCLQRRIGQPGALIGAPEGKSLGELQDQTPMNAGFSDVALQDAFWNLAESVCGALPRAPTA